MMLRWIHRADSFVDQVESGCAAIQSNSARDHHLSTLAAPLLHLNQNIKNVSANIYSIRQGVNFCFSSLTRAKLTYGESIVLSSISRRLYGYLVVVLLP